jgi:hypothetical protein
VANNACSGQGFALVVHGASLLAMVLVCDGVLPVRPAANANRWAAQEQMQSFLAVAFFKSGFESVFSKHDFKSLFFVQQHFFLSAKSLFGFTESQKLASRFFGLGFGQCW